MNGERRIILKKRASDHVIEYIEKNIRNGVWKSGMKISTEDQLQEKTGVSKASIREAVEHLAAKNILTKRQGDGTYINDVDAGTLMDQLTPYLLLGPKDTISILEFREAIEPACVQMFIDCYDQENVKILEDQLRAMELCQSDIESFHKADMEFHLVIAMGTGNPLMSKVMEILQEPIIQYHLTARHTIGSRTGLEEHRLILNAIKQKDKELASLLMRRHIQRSKKDMLAYNLENEKKKHEES